MMRFVIAFCMLHVAQAMNAFRHSPETDEQFWSNRFVHLAAIKAKLKLNFPDAEENAIQTVADSLLFEPAFRDLDSAACHEAMARLADGILGSAEVPIASAQSALPDMKEQVNAYLATNDFTADESVIEIVVDILKSQNLSEPVAIQEQLKSLEDWFEKKPQVEQQVASLAFPDVAAERLRHLRDELDVRDELQMVDGVARGWISRLLDGFQAQYGVGHTEVQIDEAADNIRFEFAKALLEGIAVTDSNICLVFSLATSLIQKFREDISNPAELRRLIDWCIEIKKTVYDDLQPISGMANWFDVMPSDDNVVKRILQEIERTAAEKRFPLVHKPSERRTNILLVDDRIGHAKVAVVSLMPEEDGAMVSSSHNIWIRNTSNHFYPLRPVSAKQRLDDFRAAEAAKTQIQLINEQVDSLAQQNDDFALFLLPKVDALKWKLRTDDEFCGHFQTALLLHPSEREGRLTELLEEAFPSHEPLEVEYCGKPPATTLSWAPWLFTGGGHRGHRRRPCSITRGHVASHSRIGLGSQWVWA